MHAATVNAFRSRLLRWFDGSAREFPWRACDATPYIQVLTEILVQQTRAENVAAALPRIVRRYDSWQALAKARISDLERVLRPLGLWRRRARAIKNLARALSVRNWIWPIDRQDLESLPAVGQYVASAVRIFVYEQREPLLDTNMARILERYFGPRLLADIRYDPWLQSLARRLVAKDDPRRVNWATLDFGALVCTARNPLCSECPLRTTCLYALHIGSGSG
ncbi:hypothetical protein AYO47_02110 [Planctomyces sp. SCGC AG-212-M04]|nr:hypothetical protein AYO47_02110 [Planctomyces sp. SCGC AG-212-M04]